MTRSNAKRCHTCDSILPLWSKQCDFCASRRQPKVKPKVAGSGQIAGPTYRHQIARELHEQYERERGGK